jgi:two-component system sensor histidine kinase ChiS
MSTTANPNIKANILVIDDTPANLRLLAGMLMEQGYKVRPAPNGEMALTAAKASIPDLILLDITMPGMNGYEVAHHLKADGATADVPIIFISALDEVVDKIKAFNSGGVDYITKPFQFEEVLARVETHLTLRRLQLQLEHTNEILEQRVQERTAELVALNRSLERFVPQTMMAYLGKDSITDVELGDQVQREMTVLFSDIRGFTALSERMTPQENFNFLNDYLQQISPVIRENDGFIDKYVGDGLMAVFPQHPIDAVNSAIKMQRGLAKYNQKLTTEGKELIRIGIGINAGNVMLGVIGEEKRIQGTVISDAVNVASRLEGLTNRYDIGIAACQGAIMSLPDPDSVHFRFLDRVQAKGRMARMDVYEVFDGDPPDIIALKQQTKSEFEHGIKLYYDRSFSEAAKTFEQVLQVHPNDKVAHIHFTRANRYAADGVPDDWNGVELLTVK